MSDYTREELVQALQELVSSRSPGTMTDKLRAAADMLERDGERESEQRVSAERTMLQIRGVETPCEKCGGLGTRLYGSTATWRGGVGGAAMTTDVCDVCWGTGDAHRTGANLREMSQERRAWEADQCLGHFARVTGCTVSNTREHMMAIAEILDREERRRKTPFDDRSNAFWWRATLRMVASGLRNLSKGTPAND